MTRALFRAQLGCDPAKRDAMGRTAADHDVESRFAVLRVLEERQKSQKEEGYMDWLCN